MPTITELYATWSKLYAGDVTAEDAEKMCRLRKQICAVRATSKSDIVKKLMMTLRDDEHDPGTLWILESVAMDLGATQEELAA